MDYLEQLKNWAPIGAIFAFLFLYFDKEYVEYKSVKKKYFEGVLALYIERYKKNGDIKPVRFINEHYTYEDYYIPPYVRYLIDHNDDVKLHKVLIEDYKCNFPSEKNSVMNTMFKLSRFADIIYLFLYLLIIFLCLIPMVYSVTILILKIFGANGGVSIWAIAKVFGVSIIAWFILTKTRYFFKDKIVEDDEYSTNEKWIIKNIDRKIRNYEHNKKKDYLK
ncbi:hypothetical protein [Clostridium chrysemydis]|uniref:hypothetical protein n=1 Tax=Clostridium chrysemydis TaxID=2665504 RepID=UPI0018831C30|nr:hypothetical protein [Clostridium chrysemydis]